MEVIDKGEGTPELAVVGSIHGDEPAGKKAIERVVEELDFKKPVRFIIANEEALKKNVRYIESDLNRSFPGDKNSKSHEEKLAAEILDKLEGMTVLDIHTTRSYAKPFATIKSLEDLGRVKKTSAEKAVYFTNDGGTLTEYVEGVLVEAGYQGSEQAAENAVDVIKNFLAAHDAIEENYTLSEPEVFKYLETVEGDYEFLAENFEKVEEGEVYARNDSEELVAEKDFYPVLMSTNGYDGQLGFKAKKLDV